MLLAAIALWLPALLSAPQGGGLPAHVEVLEGRAFVAVAGGILRLDDTQRGDQAVEGAAHLELSAGSRARVSWRGQASLLLEGRTVLEWRPWQPGSDALLWEFAELSSAHLELRRGRVFVRLADGWAAQLHSGAYFIQGRPGSNVELVHDAGLPLDLWPPSNDGQPAVPYTVLAGAQLRLVAGTTRPIALAGSGQRLRDPHARLGVESRELESRFPPWQGFAWPWWGEAKPIAVQPALAATAARVDP
jgi:hypothetical protein